MATAFTVKFYMYPIGTSDFCTLSFLPCAAALKTGNGAAGTRI